MGRSRQQERKLTEALAAQRLAGRREGQRQAVETTYYRLLKNAAAAILAAEIAETLAILTASGPAAALSWLETTAVEVWPVKWVVGLRPPISALFEQVSEDRREELIVADPRIGAMFPVVSEPGPEYLENLGKAAETSRDRIREVLEQHQTSSISVASRALRDADETLTKARADFIARDVLLKSARQARYDQAAGSGVIAGSYWRDSNDNKVRKEHEELDGSYAALGERFPNGDRIVGASDYSCRCSQEFVLDREKLGMVA